MPVSQQRLGEYVLIDRIGGGAFGEVWRARHNAWADQIVAVKIPTDPLYVRNLQKEGFAIQRLLHPCIVKPIGFDPYADPPYLVMEYVPGCSLRQLIQKGPMAIDDAVAVMKQVLAALHQAHRSGLVHRDIKPENILIHERAISEGFSAKGFVKLTDFGLGKSVNRSEQSIVFSEERRESRQIVGSSAYMSPEQRDGMEVDAQSDLYSCGVVFFEMLTGKRPAGAEMPSELNAAVPKAMDEVFRRAFARKERRFTSAEEFYNAIKDAATSPTNLPVRKSDSRNSQVVVIGAFVTAAAAIAMATLLILHTSQSPTGPALPSNYEPAQVAATAVQITPGAAVPSPTSPPPPVLANAAPVPLRDVPMPVESEPHGPTLKDASSELMGVFAGKYSSYNDGIITMRGDDLLITKDRYKPPVVFNLVAQTDSTNLRIGYAAHQIIFNWETIPTELRIDGGPADARHSPGAGHIPAGQWVDIELAVLPDSLVIQVDGRLRYKTGADFSRINDPFRVWPSNGSVVRVKSFSVSAPASASRTASPDANPRAAAPIVAPEVLRAPISATRDEPKRIVYICSGSGSMLTVMNLLKINLEKAVNGLNQNQAFDVLFYQKSRAGYFSLAPDLVAATDGNKEKLAQFLQSITGHGSTHIIPALTAAFDLHSKPDLINLMTNGFFPDETGPVVISVIDRLNAKKQIKINSVRLLGNENGNDPDIKSARELMQTIAKENSGVYTEASFSGAGD